MSKETILGVLRALLTLAGTYLVGHNLLGVAIDSSTWQIILGAVVAVGSTIWGIVDKTAGIEQIQSAIRSVIISLGGILVAAGKLKGEVLEAIVGLVTAALPLLQSYTAKAKVVQMAAGTLVPQISEKTALPTGLVVKQSPPVADSRAKTA